MTSGLPSRDEVLSGALHSGRRATRVVTAIELRVAYLQKQVRQAIAAHLFAGEGTGTANLTPDYLSGIRLSAQSGAALTAWDIERHADQWAALVPPTPEARVALIEEMARRHYLFRQYPRTLVALGCGEEATRDCYEQTYGRPLNSVLPGEIPPRQVDDALSAIEDSVAWVQLPAGSVLLREGDPGDSAFIVISGRLQITAHDRDGVEQEIAQLGRGQIVGEIALFAGMPRTATARALRDSKLIEIPSAAIDGLALKEPERLIALTREIVRRMATRTNRAPPSQLATIAILPANEPVRGFARQLAQALGALGSTLHLDSKRVRELFGLDPNEAASDPVDDSRLVAWLDVQETSFRYVLYEPDFHQSLWTERCIRQADRVLLVASTQHPASLGPAQLLDDVDPARLELLLLHPAGATRTRNTSRWLALRSFRAHHHVREGNAVDARRAARRMAGKGLGLVLSGGGARGFSHAGVMRALDELGIEVDVIGGTSMGAWLGAMYAMGWDYAAIDKHASFFASRRALLDFTLPITSFTTGAKLTTMFQRESDGACIEDLWRPFYCISSNLTRAEQVIHRTGPLWRAVRASTALPGIYPPLLLDGEVLVDGGLINNFPLDIMRATGEVSTVIGVNVSPVEEQGDYQFGDSVSGWKLLRESLRRSGNASPPPSLFATITRSVTLGTSSRMRNSDFLAQADLMIQPRVDEFGTLDFDRYRPIIDAGYQTALPELERWQRTRGEMS